MFLTTFWRGSVRGPGHGFCLRALIYDHHTCQRGSATILKHENHMSKTYDFDMYIGVYMMCTYVYTLMYTPY